MKSYEQERQEEEATILAARGVERIDECSYRVIGRPYTIRFTGRTEDGFACLWECDCPAGRHGKPCKHWRQVASAVGAMCDEFGYE